MRILIGAPVLVVMALIAITGVSAWAEGGPHQVRLAGGTINDFTWSMLVESEESGNPRRPCITTVTSTSESWVCGSVDPIPLLLGDSSGEGASERTLLALAFPKRAAFIRLWLQGRRNRIIELHMLSRRQAKRTGLERFRYAARAYAGRFCLRRFTTYDWKLHVLDVSPRMPCSG